MRTLPVIIPALTAFALATLTGCKDKPETFNDTIADPMANQMANAAPVEVPPPLKSSKSYRCKDNSLVFIDLFADDKGANLRTEKDGKAVKLTAAEKNQPLEAEGGYRIETGAGAALTVTVPGKPAQSCKP